jgi:hypothetical protein
MNQLKTLFRFTVTKKKEAQPTTYLNLIFAAITFAGSSYLITKKKTEEKLKEDNEKEEII